MAIIGVALIAIGVVLLLLSIAASAADYATV